MMLIRRDLDRRTDGRHGSSSGRVAWILDVGYDCWGDKVVWIEDQTYDYTMISK